MQRLSRFTAVALVATLLVSGGVGAALTGVGSTDTAGTAAALSEPAYASDSAAMQRHVNHENGSTTDYVEGYLDQFDLTAAQRSSILEPVEEMEADGADRREVGRAVAKELQELGYSREEIRTNFHEYRLMERFVITEAQASDVVSTVAEMREDGADREEIRGTVEDLLQEFDATPPWARHLAAEHDLTDEQTSDLVDLVWELHAEGADRSEIRDAVREQLVEFGVDEDDLTGPTVEQRAERIAQELQTEFDLTDEQAEEIATLIVELHEDGADRAEIRQAVREQLIEFGVSEDEIEDAWKDHRTKRFADNLEKRFDVTEEQAREIATDARTMRENGRTWPAIYGMMETKLQSFGVSEDEIEAARIDHQVSRLRCFLNMNDELTDEERSTIVADARSMLEDGGSQQELREMVRESLEEYDALDGVPNGGHDHDGHDHGPDPGRDSPGHADRRSSEEADK